MTSVTSMSNTPVTSSSNDPTTDAALIAQANADGQAADNAVYQANSDSIAAGGALLNLLGQYPDFPGNLDINNDSALTQWFATNHPDASSQLSGILQQRDTSRQEAVNAQALQQKAKDSAIAAGFDVPPDAVTPVPPIVSQTLDELNNVTIGDDVLQAAQQAGSSMAIDMAGMDLTDMLMMVFAASNQVKEGLTEEEVGQLNDQNQEVGTLTDLMSQISDQVPPNPDSTPETVDSSVLDTLKASGVEIPAYTTSADGKTSTMAASDLSKLVDNIKSVIDTKSNNTQLAIQGITKCNNDIAENYQVMSTTQSDVHQSKMGLASGH